MKFWQIILKNFNKKYAFFNFYPNKYTF